MPDNRELAQEILTGRISLDQAGRLRHSAPPSVPPPGGVSGSAPGKAAGERSAAVAAGHHSGSQAAHDDEHAGRWRKLPLQKLRRAARF